MRHRMTLLVPLLLTLLGCSRSDAPIAPPTKAPAAQQFSILVVGDETATDVAAELRNRNMSVTEDRQTIDSASLIVIAQDATLDPSPVHRELAQEIARSSNRKILWTLTKSSTVDDPELLELEELEARELLNKYGLLGDTIPFAVDAESVPVPANSPTLKGWTAIQRFALEQSKK